MGNKNRLRVLLADDHTAMLEEVGRQLRPDYEVVGTVEDGGALVEAAKSLHPDLIISDISMPVMTGFEAAAKIRASGLNPKLIFLTVQSSAPYLKKAYALGANGYVLKAFANEQLLTAISTVAKGGKFLSPQLQSEFWK